MRLLITALLGIAVITGLVLYLGQSNDELPEQNDQEQDENNNLPSTSWQSYDAAITSDIRFSVQYPPRTSVSKVQDTIYEIKYVGPESGPNTEITDGYYASIMFHEATELDTYVEEQDPSTKIQTLPINGRDGVAFTTQSELGNQTISHIAYRLFPESDWIVDIGYTAHGELTAEYRDELLEIFRTIAVTQTSDTAQDETTLRVAMLDYDQLGEESDGPTRGCDRLVFIEETVDATTTPLNASLHTLFEYEDTEVGGWQNFIAKTNDTLHFDRVDLENGVASIYLTGELSSLAGVCDNPRARIQIEETALQFDTVDEVIFYLNGEETELQPSGRGD